MQYKTLGHSDLKVSALGLGCMGMSFAYDDRNDQESNATLELALDLGVNFWDTADMYGQGENEKLLAPHLKKNRDKIVLATKFGFRPKEGGGTYFDGSPEYLRQACDASLLRLGIDTIDLYYAHRADGEVPIEETVGAMAELIKAGKVRYLGLSEVAPETLRKAHAVHPITALQSEYSMFSRDVEKEVLPLCQELGISFIPYSPLGRAMLTGKVASATQMDDTDFRKKLPRFQQENFERNQAFVNALTNYAQQLDATAAQLAIAWVLHQGENIIPIPGTKKRKYLQENAQAASIQLSTQQLNEINQILEEHSVHGARYTEGALKLVNR